MNRQMEIPTNNPLALIIVLRDNKLSVGQSTRLPSVPLQIKLALDRMLPVAYPETECQKA